MNGRKQNLAVTFFNKTLSQ